MRRLVIAVDCDDVLVPTLERTVDYYNRQHGTKVQLKDFYTPVSMEIWGTDSEQVSVDRVGEFIRSDEFAQIPPMVGTIKSVAKLATQHELHLVTGRASDLEPVTVAMLDAYFPGCFTSIEHTNYFHQSKSRSKGEVCQQIGADVLIDDYIVHGESVLSHGVERVIVFGSYPWNASDTLIEGMVRCNDWNAVEAEIERLSRE